MPHQSLRQSSVPELAAADARLPARFPFVSMSKPELEAVARDLHADFDRLEGVRVPLMESLIHADLIRPAELQALVPRLSEEERGQLGAFIGLCVPACKHLEAFHDCWESIDYDTRSRLKRRFLMEEREHALMVAPFVNLARQFAELEKPVVMAPGERPHEFGERLRQSRKGSRSRGEGRLENVLALEFATYENASRLMSVCLRSASPSIIEGLVGHFAKAAPMFLTPYVPELIERKLLSSEALSQVLLRGERNYSGDFSRIFWTKEDLRAERELTARVHRAVPKTKENPGDTYMWPDRYAAELSAIHDAVNLRKARHVLGSLDALRPQIGDDRKVLEYLGNLLDRGVPVLAVLPELGLGSAQISRLVVKAQDEIGRIVNMSDLSDLGGLIASGSEKTAVRLAIQELREGTDSSVVRDMARRLPEILSWFGSAGRERLVGAINGGCPEIWTKNLDYGIDNGLVTARQILAGMEKDEWRFAEYYIRLRGALRSRESRGLAADLTVSELDDRAGAFLDKNPSLVFTKPFVDQVMSRSAQESFLSERLSGQVDTELLVRAVTRFDDRVELERYKEKIRAALIENPEAVVRLAEWESWGALDTYLSRPERFELLLAGLDTVNLAAVVDNCQLVKDALSSPYCFEKLLAEVRRPDNIGALATLAKEVDYVRRHYLSEIPAVEAVDACAAMLEDAAMDACARHRHLIFSQGLLETVGPKLPGILESQAHDYLSCNPHEIGRVLRHLPSGLADELIEDNVRAFAILRGRDNEPLYDSKGLPPEVMDKVLSLNPLERVARRQPAPPDLYGALLEELRALPHYPVFARRLETLVRREERDNGPRSKIPSYSLNGEILSITERLAFLASSPAAGRHAGTILELPEPRREEICGMLELAAMYNMDAGLDRIDSLDELVPALRGRIASRMSRIFDMPSLAEDQLQGFDIELLRAMSIYYRGACAGEERMARSFREMLGEAVVGRYGAWRAWGASEEPDPASKEAALERLKGEGLLPSRMRLDQYEAWLRDERFEVRATLDYDGADVTAGIRRILRQAVADRHVDAAEIGLSLDDLAAEYERLLAPLAAPTRRKNELVGEIKAARRAGLDVSALEEEFGSLESEIRAHLSENEEQASSLKARMCLARLREREIGELSSGRLDVGRWRIALKEVFPALEREYGERFPDFMGDLGQIRRALESYAGMRNGSEKAVSCSLAVTDSVDLKTYFLIGKRPVESCQHFDSRGDLNGGLLAYVTDPSVRILQTFDDAGQIVARAVLRLMEDDRGRPQLFLERLYSSNPHPRVFEGMIELAKMKAAAIGAGLFSHSAESNEDLADGGSIVDLHSRGSRSLHVYSDAAGGLKLYGRYTINGAIRIASAPHE